MEKTSYSLSTRLIPQEGRTEVYCVRTTSFERVVRKHVGAFLNTCGGVLHFGVRQTGLVHGVTCTRAQEDGYRLELDSVMKFFQPKVSPSLYRIQFIPIIKSRYHDLFVISIHVSAGPELIYMDGQQEVMLMTHEGVYGPLYPQEIQRLSIHKYKQELMNAHNLMKVITPFPTERHSKKIKQKKRKSPPKPSTATMATQVTPKNCSPRPCSPNSVICIEASPCIITIYDSDPDSPVIVPDTPVCNPSDLFASPDCSTVKKVSRDRPEPESPTKFPSKAHKSSQGSKRARNSTSRDI